MVATRLIQLITQPQFCIDHVQPSILINYSAISHLLLSFHLIPLDQSFNSNESPLPLVLFDLAAVSSKRSRPLQWLQSLVLPQLATAYAMVQTFIVGWGRAKNYRDSDSKCYVSIKEREGLLIPPRLANCSTATDDRDAAVSQLNGALPSLT